MKRTRFSEQQIVQILREADQTPVSEVAERQGVSDATIYAWRKRFGQLEAVDVGRLRQLESENSRLKKLVAERDLDIEILKEVAAKNDERAGSSPTDRLRVSTGSIGATSVRAVERGAIHGELSATAATARRSGDASRPRAHGGCRQRPRVRLKSGVARAARC